MNTIKNPIIPGMAPDPSIIRVDDVYYIATSTFHWKPAIQIYQSNDLANWTVVDFALKNNEVNLRGSNTPAGIWAPHLSYDKENKKYWILFSHMVNMAGREFNADNYAIWSYDINGPWSEPVYLTSIGFDPTLFHDEDGKHYISILEWETREGYQAPGHIVIGEFDMETGRLIGNWQRVTKGFTTRGNAEAPQIYKRNGYYYLMISAGGTGYGHGIEIGRSRNILGPYEGHPTGEPILTSSPRPLFSLGNPDAGHFEMYNPHSLMQKAGHGSLVETPEGEWYIAHLMSRPLQGKLLNPLGRETSIQKMTWNEDDWLEMADGSNLAKMEVEGLTGKGVKQNEISNFINNFDNDSYSLHFMTPYHEQEGEWVNTSERSGHLRIYGRDSFFSRVNPSILATKAISFQYKVKTRIEFHPDHYSETAGLGLYYDSNNWLYAHLTYCERSKGTILTMLQAKWGERTEYVHHRIAVHRHVIELKMHYDYGVASFYYRMSKDEAWEVFEGNIDVDYLSDEGVNGEPGEIGGFTGLFNFIGSVDSHQHDSYADFDYYAVEHQDR